MKINWGTGIVIAIISFITFIMFMVVTMVSDKAYNHDLVTDNYYQKELKYQDNIDASKNLNKLKNPLLVQKVSKGIEIIFPKDLSPEKIKGKVFLYRPSNKTLDSEIEINATQHPLIISDEVLVSGRWDIVIDFTYNNQKYFHKEEIIY
ncbi:FixH family protein [Tenacibaculum sp. MEBiC06402]|uniref:FixH family protein n=1 Tax=unclassified Tenacibaculum TaxID=2635139 RepID=UPI003B9D9B9F